jgi:glycosyltransferase involved in cell wall biosynthesis
MPIYNGIEFIEESVSSILEQKYDAWELIIGINGHKVDSEVYQIAKEYEKRNSKIVVLDFFEIKGKAKTLNKMLHFCKYNYIALLDVDDIWHPEKLQIQSQLLDKYDVIGSRCVWFEDRAGIIPQIPVGDISDFNFTLVNPIINSSALIKKKLCYWRKEWDGVEDYDLWLRLRKQKCKFYNFEEILVNHRIHEASAFNSKGNHNKVCELLKTFSL